MLCWGLGVALVVAAAVHPKLRRVKVLSNSCCWCGCPWLSAGVAVSWKPPGSQPDGPSRLAVGVLTKNAQYAKTYLLHIK